MPEEHDDDHEEPLTPEEERQMLEHLVENRSEAKRLSGLSIYSLGIFYTLFAGFVLGMLLNSAGKHGLWDTLFGPDDAPLLPKVEEAKATFVLVGQIEDVASAILSNSSAHTAHGKALTEINFKAMGLSPDEYSLFDLRLHNLSPEAMLDLAPENFSLVLEGLDGKEHRAETLPASALGEVEAMRLRQHRPEGQLAPSSERQLWVIFKAKEAIALADIKRGRVEVGGQSIELTPRSFSERNP